MRNQIRKQNDSRGMPFDSFGKARGLSDRPIRFAQLARRKWYSPAT